MRYASSQPSDSFHFLRLPQLLFAFTQGPFRFFTTGAVSEDSDGDLISNDTDNCAQARNDLQLDTGSVDSSDPDGIGNVCQCGNAGVVLDATDGTVDASDVMLVQNALLAPGSNTEVTAICSVDGDSVMSVGGVDECNIKDVLMLDLAISTGVPLDQVCELQRPSAAP